MEVEYELGDAKPVVFNSKSDIAAMIVRHIAAGDANRHLNEIEAAIDRQRALLGIAHKPATQQITSFRVGDRVALHSSYESWKSWVGLRGVVIKVNPRSYVVRFDECEQALKVMSPYGLRRGVRVGRSSVVPESSWIKSLKRSERKG